ncbi:aqualysin-1-like isoform X2 [Ptychodera flava]|uniref:aqualysin-1-like isoform X1 n=1 Tax=Ptychodera flava TaxID=63121 RepID=UPI00396A0D78
MRLFLLALLVAAVSAADFYTSSTAIPNSYIVKLKSNAKAFARNAPAGVTITKSWSKVLNAVAVETNDIKQLLARDDVEYVQEDSIVTAMFDNTLDRIARARPARAAAASGSTVFVVDSGIRYSHVEFGGRASPFFDFEGGNGGDCNGHGTHVAGTAGGSGAALSSVRVLGCNGAGSTSNICDGLEAVMNGGSRGDVVNLSLGGSASSALDACVRSVANAGFQAVVAAGNNGGNACNYSPARVAEATTVGAEDASFSNTGPCVDTYAPGTNIRSASNDCDTCYETMSGTSMAAAAVSSDLA